MLWILTRDGHADADIRIYRAISDICRIMRISASMRIGKYIRMANPNMNPFSFQAIRAKQNIMFT